MIVNKAKVIDICNAMVGQSHDPAEVVRRIIQAINELPSTSVEEANMRWWKLVENIDASVDIEEADPVLAEVVHRALWPSAEANARFMGP